VADFDDRKRTNNTMSDGGAESPAPGPRSAAQRRRQAQSDAGAAAVARITGGGPAAREPLDRATASEPVALPYLEVLERAFGQSFADVEAHVGAGPELSALGARAATDGERIAFASQAPPLHTVAHEVAHVVQRRNAGGGPAATHAQSLTTSSDAVEREAESVARAVEAGARSVSVTGRLTDKVAREEGFEDIVKPGRSDWMKTVSKGYSVAKALQDTVAKLREAPAQIREGAERHRAREQAALTLLGLAGSVRELFATFEEWMNKEGRWSSEIAKKAPGALSEAVRAITGIAALLDGEAAATFLKDPNPQSARAWSEGVAGLFTRAGELFPDDIPVISPMIKGLLEAPANYVKAFNDVLDLYLGRIDAMTGTTSQHGPRVTSGNQVLWTGPLSIAYECGPAGLAGFLENNPVWKGVDLQKAPLPLARATLLNMIDVLRAIPSASWQKDRLVDGLQVTTRERPDLDSWRSYVGSIGGLS